MAFRGAVIFTGTGTTAGVTEATAGQGERLSDAAVGKITCVSLRGGTKAK
jgi:hypothetical protein